MLVSAFIGARLLHVGLHLNAYLKQPTLVYSFNPDGFSLFGGILLSGITGYFLLSLIHI